MNFARISVVFLLAILSPFADARSEESLIMRIFNPDYQPTDDQTLALLKKADLESHGYTKEISTALKNRPGNDKPAYEKKYLYYKTVDCSRSQEITQELQTLLPDLYGLELITKVNTEIKARRLTNFKQCKVGLEVHFKDGKGCFDENSKSRRRRRSPCIVCPCCSWIRASN